MKEWFKSSLIALVSLGLFWLPFTKDVKTFWGIEFAGAGMETIIQNFDGLNFLVVAKSGYSPQIIEQINSQFLTGNSPIYFAAHFPLFSLLIKLFSFVIPLPQALLLTVVLSNILLAISLYWFFSVTLKNQRLATLLSTVALFFPARMLSSRAVGSNEPLFIALVLGSLVMALQQKHWRAAILGALAVLTRSPGILLFGAYTLALWHKPKELLPYLLMPTTLMALFIIYGWRYQDPLAYFHSGDNLHLFFPPFSIFSNMQSWISDMWREDIVYLYLFYGLGILMLSGRERTIKYFAWIYGTILLFVAHRDLARYALPLAPIALLGYAKILEKAPRKMWLLAAILIIPIYLLGWQFVLKNIQPINDWSVFL